MLCDWLVGSRGQRDAKQPISRFAPFTQQLKTMRSQSDGAADAPVTDVRSHWMLLT